MNPPPGSEASTKIVVGITGASGAAYAVRVIELLCQSGVEVHVTASDLGRRLLAEELGIHRMDPDALSGGCGDHITVHSGSDLGASCASGSFVHDGMIVVPCLYNRERKFQLARSGRYAMIVALPALLYTRCNQLA